MNRGNTRADIFVDDKDRKKFYEILGNIEERFGVNIYVFVLMKNHYHLLLETPLPNLSKAIQSLNGNYALYFNNRHNRPGHLFQGRFKAMLVEKGHYILELSRYIHLNPARAGIVKTPKSYKWSSLLIYLGGDIELPFTLHWQWILSRFGRRKAEAMRSYYEYVIEGILDMKNPGDEAAGGGSFATLISSIPCDTFPGVDPIPPNPGTIHGGGDGQDGAVEIWIFPDGC